MILPSPISSEDDCSRLDLNSEMFNMFSIYYQKPCCVGGNTKDSQELTLWIVTGMQQ